MSLKKLLLIAYCIFIPSLTLAQNNTSPLENVRDSQILSVQNKIFELQKSSTALQQKFAALSKTITELKKASTSHSQDIIRALDDINTSKSNLLETTESLGNEIAQIKKIQHKQQKKIETILPSLISQQKQLGKAFSDLKSKTDQGLKKTTQALVGIRNRQHSDRGKVEEKISSLKKALTTQQRQVRELKDTLTSQRQKTLSHLSSLENINATLSDLQHRSQSELESVHQSLAQLVIYGLISIIGVTLVILVIFLIIHRKPTYPKQNNTKNTPPPLSVPEEDDEILMDWLKQKGTKK